MTLPELLIPIGLNKHCFSSWVRVTKEKTKISPLMFLSIDQMGRTISAEKDLWSPLVWSPAPSKTILEQDAHGLAQSSLLHVQRCRFHFLNGKMGLSFMRLITVDVCRLLKSLCTYILFYIFKYMHIVFILFKLTLNLKQYGKMYGGAKGIIVPFSLALPGHMAEESHTSTHMLIAADWNQKEAIPGAKSLSSIK